MCNWLELPAAARAASAADLGVILRAGYRYQRAAVVLLYLSPTGALTGDLCAPLGPAGADAPGAVVAGLYDAMGGVAWGGVRP